MNKQFKSYILLCILTIGFATSPQLSAGGRYTTSKFNVAECALTVTLLAGTAWAAVVLYNKLQEWERELRAQEEKRARESRAQNDEQILDRTRADVECYDNKYQELNSLSEPQFNALQLFGRHYTTPQSVCSLDSHFATHRDPHFAPLHNAALVLKNDLAQLHEYKSTLDTHEFVKLQDESFVAIDTSDLYTKINSRITQLAQLSNMILSLREYTDEEHALQPKIYQLRQERLDRERNAALRDQANALHRQADAQYRQANAQQKQTEVQLQLAKTPTTVVVLTGKAALQQEIERLEKERSDAFWSLHLIQVQKLDARLEELRKELAQNGRA